MTCKLYAVSHRYPDINFLKQVTALCQAGISLFQLREKTLSTREFYTLALEVKKITDSYQIPLIINDRLDICLAVNAAGIHIGDDELPLEVVRKILGPDKIIGVSAKTKEAALTAEENGANYLGVGAVFSTKTKANAKSISLSTLKEVTKAVSIPVYAIGGINEGNMNALRDTGVSGLAMVSDLMETQAPEEKVASIKVILKEWEND